MRGRRRRNFRIFLHSLLFSSQTVNENSFKTSWKRTWKINTCFHSLWLLLCLRLFLHSTSISCLAVWELQFCTLRVHACKRNCFAIDFKSARDIFVAATTNTWKFTTRQILTHVSRFFILSAVTINRYKNWNLWLGYI